VKVSPAVARALAWTRVEGVLLDFATPSLAAYGLGHALGRAWLGALLGVAVGVGLALRWTRMRAARSIQRRRPLLGSALEAYLEGGGGSLRGRLEAWVAVRTGPAWLPGRLAGLLLAAAWALALPHPSRAAPAAAPPVAAALSVTARVEPPAYTGWPTVVAQPPRVQGLRHSVVHLEVHTTAEGLEWAEKGGPAQTLVPSLGKAQLTFPLDRSRSLRILAKEGGPVVLLELEPTVDEAPRVTLEAPEADRTYRGRPEPVLLRASATDDVAVTRLGFRWTLAEGQGEGMRFRNGALSGRLTLTGATAQAEAELEPLALGMKAGNTLVVWAEATDGNTLDGPGLGRSDVRILRWEEAVVDFSGTASAARLPPPASQLSERELLARTERLVRSRLPPAARRARSADLAEAQGHLRESFGFFLQAESHSGQQLDVDEAEVSQSGDALARRWLAQAVSEMWAAEAELAVGNPNGALAPERAAVKALDAAFGNARLALRPLKPPDKPVDNRRRLSGAQTGLRPRALAADSPGRVDARGVAQLARRLLLSAEEGVTPEGARALADALWALPVESGIPATTLAAPLYASTDGSTLGAASREAGLVLSRWLYPTPEVLPPVSSSEASLLARLPVHPPP
jgi:hypothetical protein